MNDNQTTEVIEDTTGNIPEFEIQEGEGTASAPVPSDAFFKLSVAERIVSCEERIRNIEVEMWSHQLSIEELSNLGDGVSAHIENETNALLQLSQRRENILKVYIALHESLNPSTDTNGDTPVPSAD